jgi:TnpA family transposase
MLQRDGHSTALGEAIAMDGRIFKSLHIPSYIDTDETYRRDIKGIRNLQEGRHALARKICHGKRASCTTATSAAWRTSSAPSASS